MYMVCANLILFRSMPAAAFIQGRDADPYAKLASQQGHLASLSIEFGQSFEYMAKVGRV